MRRVPWEGGATGDSSKENMNWINSHFSNPGTCRKGEWGIQGITLGVKGRVIHTASASACFLCQVAGSKELEALTSSPQPAARGGSPHHPPLPLSLPPHLQQWVWGVTASIWPAEGSTALLCGRRHWADWQGQLYRMEYLPYLGPFILAKDRVQPECGIVF